MTTKKHSENILALSKLKTGEKGHIDYLQAKDDKQMHKLISLGALPGVPIKLLQKFPSYVFKIGQSQFAVDKELAGAIFVRILKL